MMHKVYVRLFIIFTLTGIFVGAVPGKDSKKTGSNVRLGTKRSLDNEYENVNSEIYSLISTIINKKGKCLKSVIVTGKGVGDVFDIPCSSKGVFAIISDKVLIYGHPERDSFTLFSDQSSSLTFYQDGKCTKRSYKTASKKTFAEISDMSDEECKHAQKKVNKIIEEESKYLEFVDKQVEKKSDTSTSLQSSYKGWVPKFSGLPSLSSLQK